MELEKLTNPFWEDSLGRTRTQHYLGCVPYKGWEIHTVQRRSIWESSVPERDLYISYVGTKDAAELEGMSLAYFTPGESIKWAKACVDRRLGDG